MSPIESGPASVPGNVPDTPLCMYRIHASLAQNGIPSQLVCDDEAVPVGVHIPDVYEPAEVSRLANGIACIGFDEDGQYVRLTSRYSRPGIAGTLAVGMYSGQLFPDIDILADVVVRTARNSSEVRATNLIVDDGGFLRADSPRHPDNPGSYDRRLNDHDFVGINIHLTLAGAAQVDFGLIRDRQALDEAAAIAAGITRTNTELGQPELDRRLADRYRAHIRAFGSVIVRAGGAVIFQGEAKGPHRMPVVHGFTTIDPGPYGNRMSIVTVPRSGQADTVLVRRRAAAALTQSSDDSGHDTGLRTAYQGIHYS